MKNYEIFLCEGIQPQFENPSDGSSTTLKKKFTSRIVSEIGSSSSNFSGKAINPVFYTKIDGTHELSFELPKYYFDDESGERVFNEITNELVNKQYILLKFPEEEEEYYLVINERTDSSEKGQFYYSYTCNDAFIEELSKTGYGLVFSADVKGNGLGTIHQLAEEILKDTDWEYNKTKTGYLNEYRTELEYNIEQQRYETKYIPHPVHPIEYIPELERYCNKLDKIHTISSSHPSGGISATLHNIYCYEDTEQITSNTVQNILYNAKNFSDINGWVAKNGAVVPINKKVGEGSAAKTEYYLKVTGENPILINTTAINSNKSIFANRLYLLKIEYDNNSTNDGIEEINIYNNNPLNSETDNPDYSFYWKEGSNKAVLNPSALSSRGVDRYYVLKTKQTFSNPYIGFKFKTGTTVIKSIQLFELKTNQYTPISGGNQMPAEDVYLDFLKTLPDKGCIDIKIDSGKYVTNLRRSKSGTSETELLKTYNSEKSVIGLLDSEEALSAYTHKKTMYFIRNNRLINGEQIDSSKEDSVTYLDFEEEIATNYEPFTSLEETDPAKSYLVEVDNLLDTDTLFVFPDSFESESEERKTLYKDLTNNLIVQKNSLDQGIYPGMISYVSKHIYRLKSDGKYYQYYALEKDGQMGGAWDLALFGKGIENKRRTLTAEKSNRFNLLQELSELFKVWCIFETKINLDGTLKKEVYFRENVINPNFSGFHAGVNLKSLKRTVDSDEIVTKMYVEDIESQFAENGFVTIRTSSLNPWGENYFYNFKYYVDQYLLNDTTIYNGKECLRVDADLDTLYSSVKSKNQTILDLNDKIANANVELSNMRAHLESLSYCIAAAEERIASLNGDLESDLELSAPDQQKIKNDIKTNDARKKEYTSQQTKVNNDKETLEKERNSWVKDVNDLQKDKEELIFQFEKNYSQYIKEGVWSDSTYADNDTYYLDSQKVSLTSAMPKISWNISAIDGSVLEELKDFKVKVGDQTILIDNDFFGNYSSKDHIFEVLISGIKENLDDGTKNEIEIRNYLTSFEDLFQRIAAATQTLELNEQTYNKAAYFTPDGKIDQSLLQKSLIENAKILSNSSDNSYRLDETGLHLQSLINPNKKLRIVADGIVLSNSIDNNGNPKWRTGITADGINADEITTGKLNTSLINIYSDGQPNFTWSGLGITAYRGKTTVHHDSANPQPIIAAIGDSYAEGYNASSTPIKDQSIGWIAELKKKTGLNILGTGKGASGFNPYYHLPASIETPNEFCFIKQLTAIFEQCGDNPAKLPQYIIIGGGFNDKNMEITDRVVKESPESTEKKEDYYNTELLLDVQLKDDEDGYVLLEQYALDGESGHKDECHYMINATTSKDGTVTINGKDYSWKKHSGNEYPVNENEDDEDYVDMASMETLKEAMKALHRAIYDKYHRTYGLDLPKIILVSMGRYKGLRAFREDENGEKVYTGDDGLYSELVNTHLFREKVYQVYKDQAKSMGWKYYDISGLMSPSVDESQDDYYDWVKEAIIVDKGEDYFKNDSLLRFEKESLVFQPDNVHPTGLGASVIADLVWDILKKELPESKTASSTTVDGNSFIRMDKYGIYSIDNHLGFNYTTDGTSSYPWFQGLDKYTALNKIRANSGFSLTDAGFSLNIPNAGKGSIFLGYEKLGKPNYGLYITNNKGESVIKLQNDIDDLKIGGWQLTSTSLLSKKQAPGDSKHNLITYLCTTDTPGGTAFALGKIAKEDEPGTAPFVVTGEGKLRATGATITGEINADEGRIGPFTVESERVKKTDAEEVKGAIILGESCATGGEISWVDELANRINAENIYKKADTFAGFATGKNKIMIPEIIPKNTEDIWVNIVESEVFYWRVREHVDGTFSWEQLTVNQLLDLNDTDTVLYDPLNRFMFYRNNSRELQGLRLESATVKSSDIQGKKMKIIKTSYNTKPDIPIYFYSDDNGSFYFRRKKIDGVIKYVSYGLNPSEGELPGELEPFDSSKVYYYSPTGAFIYPEKDSDNKVTKWVYFKGEFGNFQTNKVDIVPIEISEYLPPEIDPDKSHQRGYPSETIMYLDSINGTLGYWYQDFDLIWNWTNKTGIALLKIGHPKIKYKIPKQDDRERGFFQYKEDSSTTGGKWEYISEVVSTSPAAGILSLENDPDQVYNFKGIGYHMGSGEYIQAEGLSASENPEVIIHKSSKSPKTFFQNILSDSDKKNKSYYSPSKAYIYYNDETSEWIVFTRNLAQHGEAYFKKMNTFTSLLPERGADVWKNLTHIFIGGSWHERALTENDDELLELGMRQFLNTVIDRNVSGNNIKITIAAVSYSKNSYMNNQILRKTEVAYYDKVLSLRTESPYKEKLTIIFTNPSENWPTAPGAVMSEGQGKDWAPTKEGVEAMVDEIASRYELVYRGCFYGKTLDTSNKKVSSGFSLKSTSDRAIALWVHYAGKYNTPMDDFDANSKNTNSAIKNQWATNTSFYVTQGGELHSKKAYITGGNIGGCTFDENGHLEIPGAYIKDLKVSEAQIETLQVSKLVGTGGACTKLVTFTNIDATGKITATGGQIGNWKIKEGSLSNQRRLASAQIEGSKGDLIQEAYVSPTMMGLGVQNMPMIPNTVESQFDAYATIKEMTLPAYVTATTESNIDDYGAYSITNIFTPTQPVITLSFQKDNIKTDACFFASHKGVFLYKKITDNNGTKQFLRRLL